jgi:hypothetical protein
MAYNRYGFYRVCGPVEHPIYFGNMCLVILGMIAVLAKTSGLSLKNGWVATALFASFGCIVTSISFTPYVGCIAGTVALLLMMSVPFTRKLVFPGAVLFAIGLFSYTYMTAKAPLGDKPDDQFGGSMWTRHEIIAESWKKAEAAGPFGFGIRPQFAEDSDLARLGLHRAVDFDRAVFRLASGQCVPPYYASFAGVSAGCLDRHRAGVDGFNVHRLGRRAVHGDLGDHDRACQHADRQRHGRGKATARGHCPVRTGRDAPLWVGTICRSVYRRLKIELQLRSVIAEGYRYEP